MKKWICIIILLPLIGYPQGITDVIDSLRQQLRFSTHDSTRSILFAELSYRFYTNPDSALHFANLGLELATRLKFHKGIAANEYALGSYYGIIEEPVKSLHYLLSALRWEQAHGSRARCARIYMTLGYLTFEQGHQQDAIRYIRQAVEHYKNQGAIDEYILALNNLGALYTTSHQYDSANHYLNAGLALAKQHKTKEFEAVLLQSMAELRIAEKKIAEAERLLFESIHLNRDFDKRIQAINHYILATIYRDKKYWYKSLDHALISLKIAEDIQNQSQVEKSSLLLHDVYLATFQYQPAILYLKKAMVVRDSLYSIEKNKVIVNLTKQYESEQKESQIKLLEQTNELRKAEMNIRDAKIRNQQYVLAGFVIILSLCFLLLHYFKKQNTLRQLYIRSLEQNNRRISEQMEEIRLLNETLEVRVQERTAHVFEQRRKIETYAFINAHRLRGPVARLLGLLHLLNSNFNHKEELPFMLDQINNNVKEIDKVVREISGVLEEPGREFTTNETKL